MNPSRPPPTIRGPTTDQPSLPLVASAAAVPLRHALWFALAGLLFFMALVLLVEPHYLAKSIWDENWYHEIATGGYTLRGNSYLQHQNTPFSPGLPLLTRLVMWAGDWPYTTARTVLSAGCYLIGVCGVHMVLGLYSDQGRKHRWALAFFAVWPGSVFFMTGYSESLYLPLLTWCIYCLMRQRVLLASILAGAALFTRSPAIILAPLVALACLQRYLNRGSLREHLLPWLRFSGLCLGIMSLGLLGYMMILWSDVGDPLAFYKGYSGWIPYVHTGMDKLLWQSYIPCLYWSATWPLSTYVAMAMFLLMPLAIFPLRNRMPFLIFAFMTVGWCFFLLMDRHHQPFIDILRWILVLFPMSYCLAQWTEFVGDRLGRALALLMGSPEGNSRRITATLNLSLLAAMIAFQTYTVSRYIRHEWVS